MYFYAYCIYRSLLNTLYTKHQCIHYYYCSPLHLLVHRNDDQRAEDVKLHIIGQIPGPCHAFLCDGECTYILSQESK